jgi:ABC-type multidrug transport system ATPase subunit
MGVVSGQIFVDGRLRNSGFQRKTGYVQQQDLHLATSTVREALIFSALLRQPEKVPRQEKIGYVEEVIKTLEMESYADAIVGVPGEGKSQFHLSRHFRANQARSQCRTTQASHHSGRACSKAGVTSFS